MTGNETFDSNLMVKLPQVVPIMREIENTNFHEQVSKLSRLINHIFSNANTAIATVLNGILGYLYILSLDVNSISCAPVNEIIMYSNMIDYPHCDRIANIIKGVA